MVASKQKRVIKMDIKTAREILKDYYIINIYKDVGVHYNTLHRFKNGGGITLASFEKIVDFLKKDAKNHAN